MRLALFSMLPGKKMLLNKLNFPDIRRILVIAFSELSSFSSQDFFERELIFVGKLARTRYTGCGCRIRSISCAELTGSTRNCILDFILS